MLAGDAVDGNPRGPARPGNNKFKCNKCLSSPTYFQTFKDLCSHLQEVHGNEDTERKQSSSSSSKQKDTPKSYKCNLCSFETSRSLKSLTSHICWKHPSYYKRRSNAGLIPTPTADPISQKNEERNLVSSAEHDMAERWYKCEQCDYVSPESANSLRQHINEVHRASCTNILEGCKISGPFKDGAPKFGISEAESKCAELSLNTLKFGDYVVVANSELDVVISEEPYLALMLLHHLKTGKFFARVWNQTVTVGRALTIEEFGAACKNLFCNGRLCLGLPDDKGLGEGEHTEFTISYTPFRRIFSRGCEKFMGKGNTSDGGNVCKECLRLKDNKDSEDIKEEAIDIIDAEVEEAVLPDRVVLRAERKMPISDEDSAVSHIARDEYKCNRCSDPQRVFQTFQGLCSHLNETHGTETSQCSSVNKADESIKYLRGSKKCPWCPKVIKDCRYLRRHMTTTHFWGCFTCRQCGTRAEFASNLVKHMEEQDHTNNPLADCPSCKKSFHYAEMQSHYVECISSAMHSEIHKREVPPICPPIWTPKPTNTENEKAEGLYKCEQCNFVTSESAEVLGQHKTEVHAEFGDEINGDVPMFEGDCSGEVPYGTKGFDHKDSFKQCGYCEYKSSSIVFLKLHMAKHLGAQFRCSYCEKELNSQESLEAHERMHSGEKIFKCDVCGNNFKTSRVLYTHMQGVHKIFRPRATCADQVKRIRTK